MRIAVFILKCHIRESEWINLVYAQFKAVHDTSSNHCKHFGAGTYELWSLKVECTFILKLIFIEQNYSFTQNTGHILISSGCSNRGQGPGNFWTAMPMLPFGSFWDTHRNSKDCMMGEKVHKIMTFCTICQMGGISLKFPLPRDSK